MHMGDFDPLHTIENRCVIDLVQASLGLVSTNIYGIWFVVIGREMKITFVIREQIETQIEDIEDIVFELEALQAGTIDVITTYNIDLYQEGMVPPKECRIFYISKAFV